MEQEIQDVIDASSASENNAGQDVNNAGASSASEDVNKKADSSNAEEGKEGETGEEGKEQEPTFANHPRFQQLLNSNKELKGKLQEYEANIKSVEGLRALERWVENDPAGLAKFLLSQAGGQDKEGEKVKQEVSPYETYKGRLDQFEPEVAEMFKFLIEKAEHADKIASDWEKMKAEEVKNKEAATMTKIEQHKAALDDEYDRLVTEAGYMDKEGKGDEKALRLMAGATLTRLKQIAKDKNFPTKTELKTAFDDIVEGLKSVEKIGLSKNVKGVPPSGSVKGQIPSKKVLTDQDTINDILTSIGG